MPKFSYSLSLEILFDVFSTFDLPNESVFEKSYIPVILGDLVNDTRKIKTGDVFCAVIGNQQNGNDYIAQAVSSGSALIISECKNADQHGNVTYLLTKDSASES